MLYLEALQVLSIFRCIKLVADPNSIVLPRNTIVSVVQQISQRYLEEKVVQVDLFMGFFLSSTGSKYSKFHFCSSRTVAYFDRDGERSMSELPFG